MSEPLFITRDDTLLDELARLAAAAGVTPEVASDPTAALGSWTHAPMVFVGVDVAAEVARLSVPRRDGVHLLSWGRVGDDLFRLALAIHAENVVGMPDSADWVVEHLTDLGEEPGSRASTLAVVGGSGGVGATTLAAALAQVAARSGPALAVDLDPIGPGLDRVLGLECAEGVRWSELGQTTGRISARSLREGVPRRRELGVLASYAGQAGAPPAFAVREAVTAAQRGHRVVVLDVPRAAGEVRDEVLARADRTFLVVTPTVTGLTSAMRVASLLGERRRLAVVVRGTELAEAEVARALGLPVAGSLPEQRGLQESVDLGLGPVRTRRSQLGRFAEGLLALRLPARAAA